MKYTNDIAGRFEAAVCSLVLAATAPDDEKAESLQADATRYVEIINRLVVQQIGEKADQLLRSDPEEFRAYLYQWKSRSKLDEEGNPND